METPQQPNAPDSQLLFAGLSINYEPSGPVLCACGCGTAVKWPGAKYSHGHHLRLYAFKRKPDPRVVKTCPQCTRSFVDKRNLPDRKYCSIKCSVVRHKKGENRNCRNCGREFYAVLNRIKSGRGIFCSNSCRLKNWNSTSLAKQCQGSYRNNAYKVYGRKCCRCGYDKYPRILVVHHVDGNRKNGLISNLEILCPNCHAEAHLKTGNKRLGPTARVS